MKSLICGILLLFMFCSGGCAVVGKNKEYQPFDTSSLDRLVVGRSTAREVAEIFGAPTQVVKMSNGNAYLYQRGLGKGTALWLLFVSFGNYDKQYDRMVFFFDNQDSLTHYGVSLHANDASYGLPF